LHRFALVIGPACPLARGLFLSAPFAPIIAMRLALVFRGVAWWLSGAGLTAIVAVLLCFIGLARSRWRTGIWAASNTALLAVAMVLRWVLKNRTPTTP
jgi:hypothetical protein